MPNMNDGLTKELGRASINEQLYCVLNLIFLKILNDDFEVLYLFENHLLFQK